MNERPDQEVNHDSVQNRLQLSPFELEERVQKLEITVASNQRRIRSSRALNALLAFCGLTFLFVFEFRVEKGQFTGNIQSRTLNPSDIASLAALGAGALGVIGADDVAAFFKKSG